MRRSGDFEITGRITRIENHTMGTMGSLFQESRRLRERYGPGLLYKGHAKVKLVDGTIAQEAEIYWYESPGLGILDQKIKRVIRW